MYCCDRSLKEEREDDEWSHVLDQAPPVIDPFLRKIYTLNTLESVHGRQPALSLQHLAPGARGGGGGEGEGEGGKGGGRGGGGEGGEGGGEGGGRRQVLTARPPNHESSASGPRASRVISNLLEEQQRQFEAKSVSGDAISKAVVAVREGRAGGAGLGLCERLRVCVCARVCVCEIFAYKYLNIDNI